MDLVSEMLSQTAIFLTSTHGSSGANCLLPVLRLRDDCLCIGVKKKKIGHLCIEIVDFMYS